jgi:hypothetical protein
MGTFCKLFGSLPAFVCHCFDRIVIQGCLPLLTRPEHIVHFFRDSRQRPSHRRRLGALCREEQPCTALSGPLRASTLRVHARLAAAGAVASNSRNQSSSMSRAHSDA